MYSNYLPLSDLPYSAYGIDTVERPIDHVPSRTQAAKHVIRVAEQMITSCWVEPLDIELISLAVVAHPEVACGKGLSWVDSRGNPVAAFEPNTPWLWHKDPHLLNNSGRPIAVVQFNAGQYGALVEGTFIWATGEEAFYKTLLTAIHQYGAGLVSVPSAESLRMSLATFMQHSADKLGQIWLSNRRNIAIGEAAEIGEIDHNITQFTLEKYHYLAWANEGQYPGLLHMKAKGKIVESLVGLISSGLPLTKNKFALESQVDFIQTTPIAAVYANSATDKNTCNNVVVPLMATSTASAAGRHSGGSHIIRAAAGILGLTSALFIGKQFVSRFTRGNEKSPPEIKQQYADTVSALPLIGNSPPEMILASADNITLFHFPQLTDDKYRAFSISDDDEIAYRLTQHEPEAMLAPTRTGKTTIQDERDDIKIEKIDLSCVEERQTLSISDIFRKIGKTLSYPITELAKESQVVIYYERFKQCPTEQDIKKIETITQGIDTFVSYFMSFLPDGAPFTLLQNMGGPLFQLIADAIDGKELDADNLNSLNDQLLFLARVSWDFSPKERNGKLKKDKVVLPQDTFFKNSRLSTFINNDLYQLGYDGRQYLAKNTYSVRPIKYSFDEGRWLFIEDNAYFYEVKYHEDMVNAYKVSNHYIQGIRKYNEANEGLSFDKRNRILHVLKKNDAYAKFFFLETGSGRFNIESGFYKIDNVYYAYAKKEGLANRIIRRNNNDFYFEARSSKINDKLAKFMSENLTPKGISDSFHVSSIMNDGFSYDAENKKYLKYNNGYYQVDKDEYNCDYLTYRTETKPKKRYIKKKASGFFDIDRGFSNEKLSRRFIKTNEGYIIEKNIADTIKKNGVLYDDATKFNIENGLFKNERDQLFFSLNSVSYRVVDYKNNAIRIKNKHDDDDDIFLFATHEGYFENNRDEKNKGNKFVDVLPSACKVKRSPNIISCKMTVISQIADNLLHAKARKGAVSLGVDEERLRLSELFPGLFADDEKKCLYFRYDGCYYRAEFRGVSDGKVLNQPVLHVYHKGIFGGKKTIANLVFDLFDKKTVIQTQEEVMCDNTHMTIREAIDYTRAHGFLKITDFSSLKDVMAEVNKKAKLKFALSSEIINVDMDMRAEAKFAFSYTNDDFRLLSFDEISDEEPLYIRGSGLSVRNSIQHAKMQIDVAVKELDKFTPNAQKYIGYILGDGHPGFIKDFALRLSYYLKEVKGKISEDNIRLVTKNREPIAEDAFEMDVRRDADTLLHAPVDEPYFHHSALTETQRREGAVAFVPLDADKNIYVCLDKLYFIDPVHPDETLRQEHCLDITETLIHEGVHSMGLCHDIYYVSTEEGKLIPVLDAIDELEINILKNKLDDKEELINIQREYMMLHPEYSAFSGRTYNNNDVLNRMLHYMFSHDIGFKSNVLLATPDFFAIFVRDLYLNAAVVQSRR